MRASTELREARAVVVSRLKEADAHGPLTARDFEKDADLLGVHPRSLMRWVASGRAPTYDRPRYEACDRDLQAVFEARGRLAAAYRRRCGEDSSLPSRRTWERAIKRALRRDELAFARSGEHGRRARTVYARVYVERRNAVWEADHQQMKVLVLPNKGQLPGRPWITAFIDCYSRALLGYIVSFQPGEAEVLSGLYHSIVIDQTRGPFGGVPESVHYDNGRDWLSNAVTHAYQILGVAAVPMDPYAPHQKGKIERWFRTLDTAFTSQQPYYTRGPRRADNSPYGPSCDPVSIDRFTAELDEWIYHYNTHRPHRGLGGQTPLERWNDDATTLRMPSKAELVWLLSSRESRIVQKDGIHVDGHVYIASELNGLVGETLEVRFVENDPTAVEVMRDGRWLVTARLHETLTEGDRQRLIQRRREDRRRATELRKHATRAEHAQIEPATSLSSAPTPAPTDGVPRSKRFLGRIDLLGLEIDEDLR